MNTKRMTLEKFTLGMKFVKRTISTSFLRVSKNGKKTSTIKLLKTLRQESMRRIKLRFRINYPKEKPTSQPNLISSLTFNSQPRNRQNITTY